MAYNPPVTKQLYLGSGPKGKKFLANLDDAWKKANSPSLSRYVVEILVKANPDLLKGVKDGK
jgi:hypothetical protein